MRNSFENMSFRKKILFSLIPLLILLFLGEIGARFVYFQKSNKDNSSFALVLAYKYLRQEILIKKANQAIENLPESKRIRDELYSNSGEEVLDFLKKEYENNFKALTEDVAWLGSKFVVLYIPSGYYKSSLNLELNREFFSDLAIKYKVDFIDLTDIFLEYPEETITLLPENAHLSRFGNKIIVEKLSEYIEQYNDYRINIQFTSRPKLLGDLSPNHDSIWEFMHSLPYCVITNEQGLRLNYNLTFPKEKQRVLILGDSYTFGPYLSNFNTYPGLLDKKYSEKEIINAGVAGYTITDEASLFNERAKYIEPDIVILQVLDNDIFDLFYFKRNQTGRKDIFYQPSKVEKDFLNKIQ